MIQFTIHQRNLQILSTEIFKVRNSLAPEIMTKQKNLITICVLTLVILREKTSSLLIMVFNQIWNIVPQNIRESNSLNEFKSLIKFWKADTCPCRLCKNYIAQVGFI